MPNEEASDDISNPDETDDIEKEMRRFLKDGLSVVQEQLKDEDPSSSEEDPVCH